MNKYNEMRKSIYGPILCPDEYDEKQHKSLIKQKMQDKTDKGSKGRINKGSAGNL